MNPSFVEMWCSHEGYFLPFCHFSQILHFQDRFLNTPKFCLAFDPAFRRDGKCRSRGEGRRAIGMSTTAIHFQQRPPFLVAKCTPHIFLVITILLNDENKAPTTEGTR